MFALMSVETGDMHLRFTYDESLPEKVKAERSTVVTAPMEN